MFLKFSSKRTKKNAEFIFFLFRYKQLFELFISNAVFFHYFRKANTNPNFHIHHLRLVDIG